METFTKYIDSLEELFFMFGEDELVEDFLNKVREHEKYLKDNEFICLKAEITNKKDLNYNIVFKVERLDEKYMIENDIPEFIY